MKWGVLILVLVAAMIMTLGPGLTSGWAQPEEEEEEEPVQAYPWDDGMIFPLADGTEARISGSRLLLINGTKETIALNGKYALKDGSELVVKAGKVGTVGDDGQHNAIIIIDTKGARAGKVMSPTSGAGWDPGDTRPAMRRGGAGLRDDGEHGTIIDDNKALLPAVQSPRTSGMGRAPDGMRQGGSSGLRDDGEHGAIIIINSRQAVMEKGAGGRTQLFFLQGGKKVPAADGRYTTSDGRAIIVQRGGAAFTAAPARNLKPGAAQLPAVQQMK